MTLMLKQQLPLSVPLNAEKSIVWWIFNVHRKLLPIKRLKTCSLCTINQRKYTLNALWGHNWVTWAVCPFSLKAFINITELTARLIPLLRPLRISQLQPGSEWAYLASPFTWQLWTFHKREIRIYFQACFCSTWLVCASWSHVCQVVPKDNKDKLNWPAFSMAFKRMPETCRPAVTPLEISYFKPLTDIQMLINKQRFYQVPGSMLLWLWPWSHETKTEARESSSV